jgi:hypothetical protein
MRWLRNFLIPILLCFIIFSIQPVNAISFKWLNKIGRHADDVPITNTTQVHISKIFKYFTPKPNQIGLYLSRKSNNLYELSLSSGKVLVINTEKTSFADELLSVVKGLQEKPSLFVTEDVFCENYDSFSRLENIENLSVVKADETVFPTQRIKTIDGFERVIQFRPGLTLGVKSATEIDKAIWLMGEPVEKDYMRVISLFDPDDLDITNLFNKAAKNVNITLDKILKNSMAFTLSNLKDKIVFIVGHIEDKAFVVQRADGSVVGKFPISIWEQEAEKNNVTLILLGCEATSFSKASGFVKPVRDVVVAQRIEQALKADNYGQMLSALVTPETPMIVRSAVADQARLIIEMSIWQDIGDVGRIFRLTYKSNIIREVAKAGLLYWLNSLFFLYVLSFFTYKKTWRKFKQKWSVTWGTNPPESQSLLYQVLRIAVFIVLLPFFTALLFLWELFRITWWRLSSLILWVRSLLF